MCFLLSLLLAPFIRCVPMEAVAPVLILVGASMLENIGEIDFKNYEIAIPAFFVIIMMPLGYSITTGIEFGFIAYAIACLVNKKGKEASPLIYIFSILFIIKYIFEAIS